MKNPAPNRTPGETFWLVVFPCVLAAVVITLLYLIAVYLA
jgi:hypothetical protein